MFTGIVQEIGRVAAVAREDEGLRLRIEASLAGELAAGDSVSVSGVCLTAVEPGDSAFTADLSPETAARSSLGYLAEGDPVNLELPLRPARMSSSASSIVANGDTDFSLIAAAAFPRAWRSRPPQG